MMSSDSSSELDRIYGLGRSVCTTTFGLRGSETSTAVKFFGALSCASQTMRRRSFAIWTDMPSPMPPKPPRSFCASSLKFHVVGSALLLSGLVAVDIHVSVAWLCGKAGAICSRPWLLQWALVRHRGCYALACLRNSVRSALVQSGTALILFS